MDDILDYGQDKELAKQFLKEFTDVDSEGELVVKYPPLLTKLANREMSHMFIELKDMEKYNHEYSFRISNNTSRATKIFYEAIDEILPSFKTREPAVKDIMDVFVEQRLMVLEQNRKAQSGTNSNQTTATQNINQKYTDVDGEYPPELIRRYEIYFKPSSFLSTPIRQVLADKIGKLVTVRGIVTRTTDVVPRLSVATYSCDQCGFETFQPIPDLVFMPLFECTSSVCKANKSVGKITMQSRGSKYIKYQEIKLQEHTDQVPEGHIPRSITIHITGELTRSCDPGDHISVSGVFLPLERSAYRLRSGGLTAETFIETHYIAKMNKTEDDELNTEPMTQEEAELFVGGRTNFLKRLADSIAPEIYGCEEIKKALLLLLVGGVDRNAHGMRIRGSINICLMGDPGVAKSQLLIFIDRLASRSQYTTGRGSSGVGLTAAVLRDPVTNELVLEGGALVLADQGVCCIDEFDKMMDADRTAIHEVMEQQTVSIAKAGIMTTLNARVSILAAANPAYGRYDPRHSLTDNLQLPPALLSRFDLLWLIRDIPSNEKDLNLAQHITNVHTHPEQQHSTNQDVIDMKSMRRYLALCKLKNPHIPRELTSKLVNIYLDIRGKAREQKRLGKEQDILFTSPRSLLAIIRLATAFCRLRLGDIVEELDIDAAFHLYASSRDSIDGFTSETSKIHMLKDIITDLLNHSEDARVLFSDVEEEAFARKMSKDQIDEAYEGLKSAETILEHGNGYISLVDPNFEVLMDYSEC